jgi:hypothetical protein
MLKIYHRKSLNIPKGNQRLLFNEGQATQWLKERKQKDKEI